MDKSFPTSERRVEFGDFQTPPELALEIAGMLARMFESPSRVIEPTCGIGAFVSATRKYFTSAEILGFELNEDYVEVARKIEPLAKNTRITRQDFFDIDWRAFPLAKEGLTLFVGNPPWVTNSALGVLGSQNLPVKSNFQGHSGFDAQTGKSNFDISEWMLIQLMHAVEGRSAAMAFLVKTSVARKLFLYAVRNLLKLGHFSLHRIDSKKSFDVSVDACLFVCRGSSTNEDISLKVFPDLISEEADGVLGYRQGTLVSAPERFDRHADIFTTSKYEWRSGIKHDASSILELLGEEGALRNALDEVVDIESEFLFPLLKSSDLGNPKKRTRRWVIATQRKVGEDTSRIRDVAPKTWAYLMKHEQRLLARQSSIYKKAPRFAIFGIGDYSYAPWKVAISSLYKNIQFHVLGCFEGRPVMVDDTCYLYPCKTKDQALALFALLQSKQARELMSCLCFGDSKRVVTKEVLGSIDLNKLALITGIGMEYDWREPLSECSESSKAPRPAEELDLFSGFMVREDEAVWL